ncbi:MAG: hypothetical protein ACI9A8_001239, partial [Cryomorphaceae bacterium]
NVVFAGSTFSISTSVFLEVTSAMIKAWFFIGLLIILL